MLENSRFRCRIFNRKNTARSHLTNYIYLGLHKLSAFSIRHIANLEDKYKQTFIGKLLLVPLCTFHSPFLASQKMVCRVCGGSQDAQRLSPCSAEPAVEQEELSSRMRQIARLVAVGAPLQVVTTAGLAAEEEKPHRPGRCRNGRVAKVCDADLHKVRHP
ncbi:uncharacterized protein PV06_06857 [Exophiala oligosperma]|uniref:Uncharacterized protein n=1 Tax=Exophiala oligosperma TaxID=215243 RepID=A0A0D2DFS8_9EURO|nr:uncharacterized protein PV06_06857 [Exophiala oligosperma]KIW41285.1 hypothetical protein PV06_06857 [Exophiala oligosperma]